MCTGAEPAAAAAKTAAETAAASAGAAGTAAAGTAAAGAAGAGMSLSSMATIGSLATTAATLGTMLMGSDKVPGMKGPTVMPAPDDDAAKKARNAALAGLATRRGRQSTILSGAASDLLGG